MSMTEEQINGVLKAYQDNADYDSVISLDKARQFVVAVRRMLSPEISPEDMEKLQLRIRLNLDVLQKQLDDAKEFIANDGNITPSGQTTFLDTSRYFD